MKLICFPHYTCGGLLCDILTGTFSPITPLKGIGSYNHQLGKIGDFDSVYVDYDVEYFLKHCQNLASEEYFGSHIWPGKLDTSMFEQVILITTATSRSKLYRWLRVYYHYYMNSKPWTDIEPNTLERTDKERETAKNYLIPFLPVDKVNCYNIEFSEIVDNSVEFQQLVQGKDYQRSIDRWRDVNSFLYEDFWNSQPARRFYEAELEQTLNKHYVYK